MPTVSAILDRAARITGLRTSSTERDLALDALQDVYRQVASRTEVNLDSATHIFTEIADVYLISELVGVQPLKIAHVSYGNGQRVPLQQVSLQELLDLRDAYRGDAGTPNYYATNGFTGIEFYPSPSIGDSVSIVFIPDVPTLTEDVPVAGEENTPSQVPAQYHMSVLLPGIVLQMLDKDQRLAESDMWQGRFDRGLALMHEWIGQFGGEANRAYLHKTNGGFRFNDQRNRF